MKQVYFLFLMIVFAILIIFASWAVAADGAGDEMGFEERGQEWVLTMCR